MCNPTETVAERDAVVESFPDEANTSLPSPRSSPTMHSATVSDQSHAPGPVMDLWYREDAKAIQCIHDVPVQGTVGDLARKVLEQIGDRPLYQAVISYGRYPIEAEDVVPLSDAGIGQEATIDIAWRLKPDIELLFEMLRAF